VLVRPDGGLSFPLAGQIQAAGMTLRELEQVLQRRLSRYIPEATVSVALMETTGNKIYVVGKVIRPGEYVVSRPIDVMQAIAVAGGVTPFADTSQIRVLRGQDPKQEMFSFNYQDIVKGRLLSQNITLAPGDTVVVP
jgi:polysaccharide export outer membrane protein